MAVDKRAATAGPAVMRVVLGKGAPPSDGSGVGGLRSGHVSIGPCKESVKKLASVNGSLLTGHMSLSGHRPPSTLRPLSYGIDRHGNEPQGDARRVRLVSDQAHFGTPQSRATRGDRARVRRVAEDGDLQA